MRGPRAGVGSRESSRGHGRPPTAMLLADGRVLHADSAGTQEIYDPTTRRATTLGKSGQGFGATVTPLPDGRVLVAGGRLPALGSSEVLKGAELYTPADAERCYRRFFGERDGSELGRWGA